MWNPGFVYEDQKPTQVEGFHRSLCVQSRIYRGSPDNLGLVLGLESGGTCQGLAFRVAAQHVKATKAYLIKREQVTNAYAPQMIKAQCDDGQIISAYTFVVRQDHPQYVNFTIAKQAQLVANGCGEKGSALDYLASTLKQLKVLGIEEAELQAVLDLAAKQQPKRANKFVDAGGEPSVFEEEDGIREDE